MSDQTPPVTTDTAGVNRTETGEITTQPVTPASPSSPTTTPSTTEAPKPSEPTEGKTLLSKEGEEVHKGAPATYSDYKVPEGFALDPAIKTDVDKLFKAANLTQEQAQQFVDFYTAKTQDAFKQPFEAYQNERQEWRQTAENDPELRGKLGAGGEVKTTIARALNSLNDPQLASDFFAAMDYTGVGDNPAFIKAFFRLSQQVTEGSHVAGRGPSPGGQGRPGTVRTPAGDLWPNLPSVANQR